MSQRKLTLSILQDIFAICKLDKDTRVPDWALTGSFLSITRTLEELSIVCPQDKIPEGTPCDRGWRCLKVEGPFDLSVGGIVASFSEPLARASISILVTSTFDTDYVMVKEEDIEKAVSVLSRGGHSIRR